MIDKKVRASWERFLNPETLKSNIITASIFSMAYEMLKTSIIENIEGFFTNGFDESGPIVSIDYKDEVLTLNKSKLYASLKWLQDNQAIDEKDLEKFENLKKCRNVLVHEITTYASKGVDFDVAQAFDDLVILMRKIEMWWFVNLEMAIDPDAYPDDLNLDEVVPGPIWNLQMLIDIALGPEDQASKYYNHFMENAS
jgi:hypothetical protein